MLKVMRINLAELSDETLVDLLTEISSEMHLRLETKVETGQFEPLNEEERGLVYAEERVTAIKAYRDRTGHGLRESKAVVDNFVNYMEEHC